MADKTALAGSPGDVLDPAGGEASRRCRGHRIVLCALALACTVVAAAVVASFVPRGHRGRRRLRRTRPWHRTRTGARLPELDDGRRGED